MASSISTKTSVLNGQEPETWHTLIAGQYRAGGAGSFTIHSPATQEAIGNAPNCTNEDLNQAIASAQNAQCDWAKQSAYQRENTIRKASAQARNQADQVGRLMALEQGKPFNQARSEVLASCDTLDYYASEGVRLEGYSNPTEASNIRSHVSFQPIGVVGMITPWNYPLSLLSWKLGPALASGCAAVVKPSPVTPLCSIAFCKALVDGGLPAALVSVITGPDAELGAQLVAHPGIAKIAMTGSTTTGKRIMQNAANHLKKITLELGGHCPAIVCQDADVTLAAKVIAYKGFRNMGQSCSSVNRVFVHRSLHQELLEELKHQAEKLRIGDGITDPTVDLGPMATREALEKVKRHTANALEHGAQLVTGGEAPNGEAYANGHYFLPTVLANINTDMLLMHEETFGPLVPVMAFDKLGDAIQQANNSEYGLAAYLFAKDYATITQVSEALEAGTVCVNNGAVNTNYAPYEGWKNSGFGLELSRRGIMEYVKTKHTKIQF